MVGVVVTPEVVPRTIVPELLAAVRHSHWIREQRLDRARVGTRGRARAVCARGRGANIDSVVPRKSNKYGSLVACCARSDCSGGSVAAKLVMGFARAFQQLGFDLPGENVATPAVFGRLGGVQSRVSDESSLSKRNWWWRHGNCAAVRCTISTSGQAAAKARTSRRLRGEKPVESENARLRSADSRLITWVP